MPSPTLLKLKITSLLWLVGKLLLSQKLRVALAWNSNKSFRSPIRSVALKAAVEQVDLKTGETVKTFPSVRDAAKSVFTYPSKIKYVLEGEQGSHKGFFWRWEGSEALPRRRKNGLIIEKLCITSGDVLERFNSILDAESRHEGIILDNLRHRPRIDGGFFWRVKGSDATPFTKSRKGKIAKAIEKICIETHNILETYPNAHIAAESVSTTIFNIYSVLQGRTLTCRGFFWRYEGSDKLPSPKTRKRSGPRRTNYTKPVEQVCLETGKVLAVYKNHHEAVEILGPNFKAEHIRKNLHGYQKTYNGYFWRWAGSNKLPPQRRLKYRPLEQVSLVNGEVVNTFDSLQDASSQTNLARHAIKSNLDGFTQTSGSYFWREAGSSETPAQSLMKIEELPVEQVSPTTGEVINKFNSAYDASIQTNISSMGIKKVLLGKQARAGTYFWRKVGSTTMPKEQRRNNKENFPIEQVSLSSLEIVDTFDTIKEAATVTQIDSERIQNVLEGTQLSAGSYFWRKAGSDAAPNLSWQKIRTFPIEQISLETGQVIKTFDTIKLAEKETKVSLSDIRDVLQGNKSSGGSYFWKIAPSNKPLNKE